MNQHSPEAATPPQTVCLCMIVKNEAPVIRRCLDSVKPYITHWIIVDTGSTDGTQDIIREHMRGIPGTLHERAWRDFAHNRSEALELARGKADYSLIIDADDALEVPPDYALPPLSADCYLFTIRDVTLVYHRIQLVSNRLRWFYRGVLHEFITTDEPHGHEYMDITMRRNHDGASRRDPDTYRRDARVLEQALKAETDPFMRSRYTFYLAQSYRDFGDLEKSISLYLARATMGGWQEEVFTSLYQAAVMKERLGRPAREVLAAYQAATDALSSRAEAAHAASRYCRVNNLHAQGYEIAKASLGKPMPEGALFAEPMVYHTGLLDEFSINAYWTGHYAESLDACLKILESGKLASAEMPRILANARFAMDQVSKMARPPNLGSRGGTNFTSGHRLDPARPTRPAVGPAPRVLLAILAKQKEGALPLYLKCIEELDYPKSSIILHIRTNNNRDNTEGMLRDWISRVRHLYGGVEFDAANVAEPVEQFGVHEWNAMRFKVLGAIRNASLRRTRELGCAFYFVCDVDNFIRPGTLAELVALNLPIVAPLLRTVTPENPYANYHAEIDVNGYYQDCDQYYWILNRWVRGLFEVPVVNGAYLVRADAIDSLTYVDHTERHDYVVFSESARKAGIVQYLDNRQIYGYIAFEVGAAGQAHREYDIARGLMDDDNARPVA